MVRANRYIDVAEIEKVVTIHGDGTITSKKSGNALKPFLKKHKTKKGYLRVNITGHGKFLVHRLVACKYKPNDNQTELTVNHIDEDTMNNNDWNTEWMTDKDNKSYSSMDALLKTPDGRTILTKPSFRDWCYAETGNHNLYKSLHAKGESNGYTLIKLIK